MSDELRRIDAEIDPIEDYEDLGDLSATPPWHSRQMCCDKCKVKWLGCWDNFQCPKCGDGELPGVGASHDR